MFFTFLYMLLGIPWAYKNSILAGIIQLVQALPNRQNYTNINKRSRLATSN